MDKRAKDEMGVTNPTAENSGASSYSVKETFLLCRAIASARPAMPAPVTDVSGCCMRAMNQVVYCWEKLADDRDMEAAARLWCHIDEQSLCSFL